MCLTACTLYVVYSILSGLNGGLKINIYIGPTEMHDLGKIYKKGFQANGVKDTRLVSISMNENPFFTHDEMYDKRFRSNNQARVALERLKEFSTSLRAYDVFIFLFCRTFFNVFELGDHKMPFLHHLDLALLRLLGKKIIMVPLGSDIRSYPKYIEECRSQRLENLANYMEKDWLPNVPDLADKNRKLAKISERYANIIYAQSNYAQFLTRRYEYCWLPMDLEEFRYNIPVNERPVIVHAPSKRYIKGTDYIISAVRRLKNEGYDFKFVLCEKMKNEKVRELLSSSDIVIDQLLGYSHGLFALEAMACGNIVLGGAISGYKGLPPEIPIITSNPETIYENLKNVLHDREKWNKLYPSGREYIEKYHDYRKVTGDILADIGNI